MANSNIKLKRKVRLRKKVEEQEHIVPSIPESKKPFWKQWQFWLKVLLCVAVISIIIAGIVKDTGTEGVRINDDKLMETEITEKTVSEESDNMHMPEKSFSDEELSSEVQTSEQAAQSSTKNQTKLTPYENLSKPSDPIHISNDVEAEAMKVIRGDYGVGQERKDKLGNQYQPIQNRVNQLKREGAF